MLELEGKRITDSYIRKRVNLTDEIEFSLYRTSVADAGMRAIAGRARRGREDSGIAQVVAL